MEHDNVRIEWRGPGTAGLVYFAELYVNETLKARGWVAKVRGVWKTRWHETPPSTGTDYTAQAYATLPGAEAALTEGLLATLSAHRRAAYWRVAG
jgi:hypothetical protein